MNKERFYQVQQKVVKQNEDCPVRQYDAFKLAECLKNEVQELEGAVNEENPLEVASEMGDVLYLLFRMAHETGIDLLDAVELKLCRNELKYNAQMSKDDGRTIYKKMGGDDAFFQAFTDVKG